MLVAGGAGGGPTGVLLQKDVVALQHEGGGGGGGGVAVLSLCTEIIKALFICLQVRVRLFSKLKGRKKTAESQAGDCCRRHF